MNVRFSSRCTAMALAICAALTVSSCRQKSDESVTTEPPPPPPPSSPTSASSPSPASTTSSAASKQGVAPQGTACPSGNPVKGVSSKKLGKIALTSKSPEYDKTKPEKCFPDVNSAKQAGYQAQP